MKKPSSPEHCAGLPRRGLLLAPLGLALLSACGAKKPKTLPVPSGANVLALGDSLTAGVGTSPENAFAPLLAAHTGWQVVNAGISGHTSAQALARLSALLEEHHPALVLVGIGGNDFLQRQPEKATRANIEAIVKQCQQAGAQVLLIAMPELSLIAASTGRLRDHPLYAELAESLNVPLQSQGWSTVLSDNQLRSDAVHANTAGYARFTELLEKSLRDTGLLR
jgi:acyl-CoA thioesterase-1